MQSDEYINFILFKKMYYTSRIPGNAFSAKVLEKKLLQKCDDHCIIPVT